MFGVLTVLGFPNEPQKGTQSATSSIDGNATNNSNHQLAGHL
jgi:hypothetical protein